MIGKEPNAILVHRQNATVRGNCDIADQKARSELVLDFSCKWLHNEYIGFTSRVVTGELVGDCHDKLIPVARPCYRSRIPYPKAALAGAPYCFFAGIEIDNVNP